MQNGRDTRVCSFDGVICRCHLCWIAKLKVWRGEWKCRIQHWHCGLFCNQKGARKSGNSSLSKWPKNYAKYFWAGLIIFQIGSPKALPKFERNHQTKNVFPIFFAPFRLINARCALLCCPGLLYCDIVWYKPFDFCGSSESYWICNEGIIEFNTVI